MSYIIKPLWLFILYIVSQRLCALQCVGSTLDVDEGEFLDQDLDLNNSTYEEHNNIMSAFFTISPSAIPMIFN